MGILLTDEESRKEEDKSYKLWERDGGNLGAIRRRLVAKAQLKKVVKDIISKYGSGGYIHYSHGVEYRVDIPLKVMEALLKELED